MKKPDIVYNDMLYYISKSGGIWVYDGLSYSRLLPPFLFV